MLTFYLGAQAQNTNISDFEIKTDPEWKKQLIVEVKDSLSKGTPDINGLYTFEINGFSQELAFKAGKALVKLPIEKSTFVYIKHQNEKNQLSQLVYVYKNADHLSLFKINRIFFLIVPALLVMLVWAFRKLIYLVVVLGIVFIYVGHQKGLNISTYFETVFDYLRNLIP